VTASLAYEWNDDFGTYWEIAATLNNDDRRGDKVILATGITYSVTDNLQLDAGVNFGVTEASDRVNPFVGVSRRF
jgi:long-subunit fatty acid transport protein